MGKGYLRQKNALKRQYLSQAVKYIDKLEAENEALRGDPNTYIGQFITQFRELYSQNARLSVLAASLMKRLGDRVELSKDEMEAFKDQRINIKWELPEGVTEAAEAASFIFTYEALAAEGPQPVDVVPPPANTVLQTEVPDAAIEPSEEIETSDVLEDENFTPDTPTGEPEVAS